MGQKRCIHLYRLTTYSNKLSDDKMGQKRCIHLYRLTIYLNKLRLMDLRVKPLLRLLIYVMVPCDTFWIGCSCNTKFRSATH
jgi:hypothetical protein